MKVSNKQIKNSLQPPNVLKGSSGIVDNQEKIDTCVIKSKLAFYENEAENDLSKAEFLYQQSQYIHKRWWAIQGLILFVLWWIMKYSGSDFYIHRSMWIMAPLFVVLIMPELWKNRQANAMEVECTAYYSLRQVYAARLVLFAMVDLVLLSVFCLAAVYTTGMTMQELVVQFFLPCNVTCCICFHTLYSKMIHSEIFTLLLCVIWSLVWALIVWNESVYNAISVPVWNVLLIMSILYLGYCIHRGQRKCDDTWGMIWNEE